MLRVCRAAGCTVMYGMLEYPTTVQAPIQAARSNLPATEGSTNPGAPLARVMATIAPDEPSQSRTKRIMSQASLARAPARQDPP